MSTLLFAVATAVRIWFADGTTQDFFPGATTTTLVATTTTRPSTTLVTTTLATTTLPSNTTTSLPAAAGALGFGFVHVDYCDASLKPGYVKTLVPESYLSGTTVNVASWRDAIGRRTACHQTEIPVAINMPAWNNAQPADLQTIFRGFMQADPRYVASGAYTPAVPAWEWGLEENLNGKCCTASQVGAGSVLYNKLAALQQAKLSVNGGAAFKVGYQIAELRMTDIGTFIGSAAGGKVDFLALHPYKWPTFETPETWFDGFMDQVDTFKRNAGRPSLPIWFTEVGVPTDRVSWDYQARYALKLTLMAYARGVEVVTWYRYRDTSAGCGPECEFGFMTSAGVKKPAYQSWMTMESCLAGKRFTGRLSPAVNVRGFVFSGGGQDCLVLWRYPDGQTAVTLDQVRLGMVSPSIVDYQGRTVLPSNGMITVDGAPVFIRTSTR